MWLKRHPVWGLFVATFLLIGVALPASAQGDEPYIVAWLGGGAVVGLPDQFISGQDYEDGDLIDLYINGDHVATATAEPNGEGTASPFFEVGFESGDEITLVRKSDNLERVLSAQDITISGSSAVADTVSGYALPGSEVLLLVGFDGAAQETANADGFGYWRADFAGSYDLMTGDIVAALQFDQDGDITAVFAAVDGLAPSPPKKASFSETYRLPEDRPLVIDQGWLNVGCDDVLYEMYSGKLDAKWKAKYVGEDEDGNWLYQMTQDFDWKNAVFESHDDDSGPTGDYFDVESAADMDALVRVVDPYGPIWPGNVEPIDGQIEMYFYFYDTEGDLADWITISDTNTNGEFGVKQEGTCNG